MNRMKLTIVFNNKANPGLKSGWGFSCLIEKYNEKVLFDTGCEGPGLLYNIKELGFDVKNIDIVVLSHQHWDHVGGLSDLLDLNNKPEVFGLKSFPEDLKNEIREKAKLKEVEDEQKITEKMYTTGLIKNSPDEQSLILKTTKGIVVIVGCSHPGVGRILETAKKYGKIYAIVGGFHGFSDFDILEGVEIIGASHCTQYMKEIKERFPKNFKELKAGDIVGI